MYGHGFVVKSSGLLLKASLDSNASLTSKSTHRHRPAAMSSLSPRSGSPQASGSTRRLSDSSQDVSSRVAPSATSHLPRVGMVFAGAADLTSPGGLAKKICATVMGARNSEAADAVFKRIGESIAEKFCERSSIRKKF